MPDQRHAADRRRARNGIAAAAGMTIGAVLGAALGVVLRIVAAVARAAFGRPQPAPPAGPDDGAPAPRPDWNTAQPERLLKPTYWPMVLALGIAFIMWGLTSSLLISYVGIALFVLALMNWIGLLRHEA